MVAVLANYRLVPQVTYPGGGEDIQLIREWVNTYISRTEHGSGDPNKVFLVGQSSGGTHIATNIYATSAPNTSSSNPLSPPLLGVVYISVPFFFDAALPMRRQTLKEYYGSDKSDELLPYFPVGMLDRVSADSPVLNLPMLIQIMQYDPKETVDANILFFNVFRDKTQGVLPILEVLPGHNHITNLLSIGTADDAQGKSLIDFIEGL